MFSQENPTVKVAGNWPLVLLLPSEVQSCYGKCSSSVPKPSFGAEGVEWTSYAVLYPG